LKQEKGVTVLSSPAISSDGTIYIGLWDDYLYAIGGK
jgi:outer membrane protein assembly factor BamB